jgi:hypothetical protein
MMGGAAGLAFSTLIMLVGVLLLIYARLMLRKRVLS